MSNPDETWAGVFAKTASLVVAGVLLSGCSPVPADPRAVLEEKAATVDSAAQDVLEALDTAGLRGASARGDVNVCQSEPAPGASYSATISVTVGEDLAAGFGALVEQLDSAGWTVADESDDADAAAPGGRFRLDDITLDVSTGGGSSGGVRYGADGMELGITIDDDCVRIPDGSYFTKVLDLEKEILPRE